MGSAQSWVHTARHIIDQSRNAGEPVWLPKAVDDILKEHPDCGLCQAELTEMVRDLVIEQRWALDGR